jgi:flavin reductase (DIM6/NTAB) family NADH-FMN oxidoreductase RutF
MLVGHWNTNAPQRIELNVNTHQPVDVEAFKQTFRRHAAGVAVVTSLTPDGSPVGFTATSLASLSADPPLATFNMARISSAWPAMVVGNRVTIHTLGPQSQHLATRMAAAHDERFTGDHWRAGPDGVPQLLGVTAWMSGTVHEVHEIFASAVIVVRIDNGALGEEDEALLYHERTYMRPAALTPGE